ncbi:hypothetical protein RF11_16225 [Thelohanellus kitauei]|uniref:Uncharacterized protein n=1 Tax=Thelohanellus kitauei TaxID=669202 RepID=A0A0C2MLA3_THEKT|nr:hypothetical protein RF11_16225 [Thelohanellus kitauei]
MASDALNSYLEWAVYTDQGFEKACSRRREMVNSGISINIKTARCTRKICRYRQPICGETFFKKCKLPYDEVLLLAYFWLAKSNGKQIELKTGHSNKIITAYKEFLRQLVSDSLDFIDLQIGGKDVVVEIYETKLGKNTAV